jgi:broad specificity phosphatase PhoE
LCYLLIKQGVYIKILQKIKEKLTQRKKYKIILIRHGQSEGNVDPKVYENKYDHEIELTELGKTQSIQAGAELRDLVKETSLDVFVSPYKRTVQTWEGLKKGLSRNNLTVEYDPRIREQEHKIFKSSEERLKIFAEQKRMGRFYYRFKNAESGVDVYSRITTFLRELRINRKLFSHNNDCVIVAHEIALRSILMKFYKLKEKDFDNMPIIENCSPIVLETYNFNTAKIVSKDTTGNIELIKYLSDVSELTYGSD